MNKTVLNKVLIIFILALMITPTVAHAATSGALAKPLTWILDNLALVCSFGKPAIAAEGIYAAEQSQAIVITWFLTFALFWFGITMIPNVPKGVKYIIPAIAAFTIVNAGWLSTIWTISWILIIVTVIILIFAVFKAVVHGVKKSTNKVEAEAAEAAKEAATAKKELLEAKREEKGAERDDEIFKDNLKKEKKAMKDLSKVEKEKIDTARGLTETLEKVLNYLKDIERARLRPDSPEIKNALQRVARIVRNIVPQKKVGEAIIARMTVIENHINELTNKDFKLFENQNSLLAHFGALARPGIITRLAGAPLNPTDFNRALTAVLNPLFNEFNSLRTRKQNAINKLNEMNDKLRRYQRDFDGKLNELISALDSGNLAAATGHCQEILNLERRETHDTNELNIMSREIEEINNTYMTSWTNNEGRITDKIVNSYRYP